MPLQGVQQGSGAGPWRGPGKVYVMKDVTGQQRNGSVCQMFKIGHSDDPQDRLKKIQKDLAPNTITLLNSYQANESNGAETAAQNAAKEQLGFVKDNGPGGRGNATDWFLNPKGKTHKEICSVVEEAVKRHNNAK